MKLENEPPGARKKVCCLNKGIHSPFEFELRVKRTPLQKDSIGLMKPIVSFDHHTSTTITANQVEGQQFIMVSVCGKWLILADVL